MPLAPEATIGASSPNCLPSETGGRFNADACGSPVIRPCLPVSLLMFRSFHLPRRCLAGPRVSESELNDAAADGDRDRLRAVAGAELFHDVFDVNLNGFLGNEEPFRNVAIPVSSGDLLKDLNFPARQTLVAHMLGKLSRDVRRNALLACVDLPDRLYQIA